MFGFHIRVSKLPRMVFNKVTNFLANLEIIFNKNVEPSMIPELLND